jgi:hypothetical protein
MRLLCLWLLFLFVLLQHAGVHARHELNDAQRMLVQELRQLMPNLAPPTIPLIHLLQQRANVRWITHDAWFDNIECAKSTAGHLLCGIYVTHTEMEREGWVEALLNTIDAANDALDWRGYLHQDYFVQYDPFWMPYSLDVAQAQCLFERGAPIMAHLQRDYRGLFSVDAWSAMSVWHWVAQRWQCVRYKGMLAERWVSRTMRDFLADLRVRRIEAARSTDAPDLSPKKSGDAATTTNSCPGSSCVKQRIRCTDADDECHSLL